MINIKYVFFLVSFFSILNVSFSQSSSNFKKMELTNSILSQESSHKSNIEKKFNSSVQTDVKEKSPYLGALFSGIIPGTGEFYAKRYLKGAIFLAVETGLWIAYASFETEGDNQTESYQHYADQNWDVYQYGGWLKREDFAGSAGIDLNADPNTLHSQINECERQSGFSHTLPAYGSQQYYELIGKYQTFVSGWKDADLGYLTRNNFQTYQSPMFVSYSYDRQQANDYYDKATTSLTLVILNHLLSAADGAWSVSMFNKDLKIKTGVHIENKYSVNGEKKMIPVANVNVTF